MAKMLAEKGLIATKNIDTIAEKLNNEAKEEGNEATSAGIF
jgi:hypothetical protein